MKRLTGIMFIALMAACNPKIIQFTNDSARFAYYQTFWVVNYKANNQELSQEGAKIMDIIRTQIEEQMQRRGYSIDANAPDLLVRYELISNQVTEVARLNPYASAGYYFPDQYFRTRSYIESALLIEIDDQKTKKLVWQASTDLNNFARKKNDEELLQEAVIQLFNTYLYRAGSGKPDETLIIK